MRKGFTLVEIMASIAILSVVGIVGVVGYRTVNEKIKEQAYKNKVTYIESKAALYGSETGYVNTTVDELVKTGYIEADNEKGEVLDPREKSRNLNDCIVTITKEGENYYGNLTDITDPDQLDRTNENLEIIETGIESGEIIEENKWTKENVRLTIRIREGGANKGKNESDIEKIRWYNNVSSHEYEYSIQKHEEIEVVQILNTEYRVEVTFKDGSKFVARRQIKIDKQKPRMYTDDVRIENENNWSNKDKKVVLLASDQGGSGIGGYYVGENEECTRNELHKIASGKYTQEQYEIELGSGEWYSCAVDKVGNISEKVRFEVKNIDKIAPTCNVVVARGTLGENGWYKSDIELSVNGLDDGGSGINQNYNGLKNKKITKDTDANGTTIKATIKDNAGNTGECSTTIKVDKTKPKCTITPTGKKGNNNWYTGDITFSINGTDNGSGINQSYDGLTTKKITTDTNGTRITGTVKDNAGNVSDNCSISVKRDATPPTKPTEGAIGKVSGSKKAASIKNEAGGSTDSGSGIKEYRYLVTNVAYEPRDLNKSKFKTKEDGGMKFTRSCGEYYYAYAVAVDNAGNISDVKGLGHTNDEESGYNSYGTCSKKCGGGTKTSKNDCELITEEKTISCNTQDCCSETKIVETNECTKTCGGGKRKREHRSVYDNRLCGTDENGTDCNTQSCSTPMRFCRWGNGKEENNTGEVTETYFYTQLPTAFGKGVGTCTSNEIVEVLGEANAPAGVVYVAKFPASGCRYFSGNIPNADGTIYIKVGCLGENRDRVWCSSAACAN